MKKKVINSFIACFLIFFNCNSYSQGIKEIRINFLDKTINKCELSELRLREGDFYRLVIDNINLNLFRVQVNYSDTIYSKPLETPAFFGFGLDAITKAISDLSDLSSSVTTAIYNAEISSQRLDTLTKFLPESLNVNNDDYNKLKVRINQENVKLKELNKELNAISYSIDSFKLSVYQFKLNSLKLKNGDNSYNLDEAVRKSLDIRSDIVLLKTNSTEYKNKFNSDYEKYSEIIRNKEDIKKAVSALNDAYDKLITALDKTILEFNADNINTLLSQVVFMNNNSNNTYKSVPLQFNGEQAILEYKIIPRDENYLLQSYSAKILFPRRKPDNFSVGLSFYVSTLYDEGYSTIGITKDSTVKYSVTKEEGTKAEIGIVSLFRISLVEELKNFDNLDFHLNFGPGISISNNVKPRLFFGIGFSCGKRHKFAWDFGGVAGYVNVLSDAVNLVDEYDPKPDNLTKSILKFGVYTSFGYYYAF